jgi:hypothetical protein
MLGVILMDVDMLYSECFAECRYAKCCYAECRSADTEFLVLIIVYLFSTNLEKKFFLEKNDF